MLKTVAKKLTKTRVKVSKRWGSYRRKKRKIRKLKLAPELKKARIFTELDKTKEVISKDWSGYREVKNTIIYKSPFADFKFVKTLTGMHKEVFTVDKATGKHISEIDPKTKKPKVEFYRFHDTTQKIYKAKKNFDVKKLDNVVSNVLSDKKVNGVLIVFQVTSEETGLHQFVSNYINREELKTIHDLNETVYDYVAKKFREGNTKDYKLKFIYMRIVYAKS